MNKKYTPTHAHIQKEREREQLAYTQRRVHEQKRPSQKRNYEQYKDVWVDSMGLYAVYCSCICIIYTRCIHTYTHKLYAVYTYILLSLI